MATYDLGDVITLTATVRDDTGDPANAGTMVCTLTAPDASLLTPVVANPATGTYTVTLTADQVGRWQVRWVATGANAGAFTQDFEVTDGVPLLTGDQVCAKQRVAVPDPDSVEGKALDQAVDQAAGLVLAYLRRDTIDTLHPAAAATVRAVAVRVAARLWRNPTDAASESYADHSVSWSDPRIFTGDERTELRPWRKRRARTPIRLIPQTPGETP